MEYYLSEIDKKLENREVDIIFFVGDVNQCVINNDYVDTVGLETRSGIFKRYGYNEDPNFKDATSNFGRAMDRIAWKVLPNSRFTVSSSKVFVPTYPDNMNPKSLSDHRAVVGDFHIVMKQ